MCCPSILRFLSLVALTATLSACRHKAVIVEDHNAPDDTLSLRIACLPTMGCLPFYYAVESGICDSLRLPLRVKTYRAQFDADTALLGRTTDGGVTDYHRLNYYREQGRASGLVPFVELQEQWRLLVGGRLRIHRPDQLKGRTVAIARYANSEHFFFRLRDSLRLSVDQVFLAQINNYDIRLLMLDNDQVDAAVLPEPYASRAVADGQKVLATARSGEMKAALFLKRSALRHTRRVHQAHLLQKAYNMAVARINRGHDQVMDSILLHVYRVPEMQLSKIRLPRYVPLKDK